MILALVLVSALLHAMWNALLRLEKDKDRALVCAVSIGSLLAIAVASIRFGVTGTAPFATTASLLWSLLAGFLEWLYFTALARALSTGPLGTVYTISRGGAVLVIWPASVALFAEPVTVLAAIGSVVVFGGLALSSYTPGGNSAGHRTAILWALTCAAAIAGYHLAYKAGLSAGASPSASFAISLSLATLINIGRLGREGRRIAAGIARTRTWRVILMGCTCGGSFLILIEALSAGGAGYVLTLRNTSVLFAIIFSAMIGEKPRASQVAGAVLVAAGAVLIAWP